MFLVIAAAAQADFLFSWESNALFNKRKRLQRSDTSIGDAMILRKHMACCESFRLFCAGVA